MDISIPAGFKVGVRGLHTRIREAIVDIVVSRNPSQAQSINTGFSSSSGFEIEVSQRVNESLSWFANGTVLLTNIRNDLDPDQNAVEIPFSPKFVANLGVNWRAPFGLVLAPALNYNDGFYDGTSKTGRAFFKPGFDVQPVRYPTPGHGRLFQAGMLCPALQYHHQSFRNALAVPKPGFFGNGRDQGDIPMTSGNQGKNGMWEAENKIERSKQMNGKRKFNALLPAWPWLAAASFIGGFGAGLFGLSLFGDKPPAAIWKRG